jgi:peroxiredoxin Q/BCP
MRARSSPALRGLFALALAVAALGAAVGTTAMDLSRAASELAPGLPAPDFTLQASDGRTYTLSDFSGKRAVVIAWFPKAFTGG